MRDQADVPQKSSSSDIAHRQQVEQIVEHLIATRGYYFVIDELLRLLNRLAKARLADPENLTNEREFTMWAEAVIAAVGRHCKESTFEQLISEQDAIRARGMAIRLD